MLKKVTPFIIESEILSGRPDGARLRDEVQRRLDGEPADIILPLDFSKVRVIDFSFTDEMLGRIIRRISIGEIAGKYIVLESLSDSLRENINMALKERELACVYVKPNSEIEILGKIGEELKKTYYAAVNKGKITSKDVLELEENMENISAASNRLTKLKELGLLTKTNDEVVNGGGRQYVYEPIR